MALLLLLCVYAWVVADADESKQHVGKRWGKEKWWYSNKRERAKEEEMSMLNTVALSCVKSSTRDDGSRSKKKTRNTSNKTNMRTFRRPF